MCQHRHKATSLTKSTAPFNTLRLPQAGLTDIRRDDWTERITHFWPAVIRSSLTGRGVRGLLKAGPSTVRGALAMLLMVRGFNRGLVKFGLITARKPVPVVNKPKSGTTAAAAAGVGAGATVRTAAAATVTLEPVGAGTGSTSSYLASL